MTPSVGGDFRVGSVLAGYRIEGLLGRGGMGVVYLAKDLRLRRNVALKLIAPDLAHDERFRERFLRESEQAASIDHSNIIPIYEAGEADGNLYLAMRYVEGTDLRTLLEEERQLEPARALSLVAQVAAALDAAHARGLVHRDVKPGNVLLAREEGIEASEHVYLSDFGLTRANAASDGLSDVSRSLGTPDYASPEQIEGRGVDGRADLYSLGCLLYECLTGEAPFERPSEVEVLFAHLIEPPPRASDRRAELPERVDEVIVRALAKSPEERPESGREFVEAAHEALGIAEPRRSRWLRLSLLLALVGIVLLAAGLAAFLVVRGGETPTVPAIIGDSLVRIDPGTNVPTAAIRIGPSPAGVVVGEGAVWVASFDDATVSRIDPDTGAVERASSLDAAPTAIAAGEGAVWVAYLSARRVTKIDPRTVAVRRTVLLLDSSVGDVAVGQAAVWVGRAWPRFELVRIAPGTGDLAAEIPLPERPGELAVGEGTLWVASGGLAHTVWRVDPSTNAVIATVELDFPAEDIAVGDGAAWVANRGGDSISRIDAATNRVAATIAVGRGPTGLAVGNGTVWVANSLDGTVSRIDATSGEVVATIDVGARPEDVAVGEGAVWITVRAE